MAKNPLLVKIKNLPYKVYGNIRSVNNDDPSCFVNSFPKSGTHLLSQVFDESIIVNDYGRFITMASSIRFKKKTNISVLKEISRIRPGELTKGHIFHDVSFSDELSKRRIPTFFIYRDIRSVIVSEMYYFSQINKFHRLSKYFPKGLSKDELLSITIEGLPNGGPTGLYTNIYERFKPFYPWIGDKESLAIKFESLKDKPEETITSIWRHFREKTNLDLNIKELVHKSILSISPKRSHTFRSGSTDSWKKEFSSKNMKKFKDLFEEVNQDLGYF
jgi:hypothetical protein